MGRGISSGTVILSDDTICDTGIPLLLIDLECVAPVGYRVA